MIHGREIYIEECKGLVHEYFRDNQLIVSYVRERKSKSRQHIQFQEGQIDAIKAFLHVTNGVMTVIQSINILNMILPEDKKFPMKTKEEKNDSIRAFESIYSHWNVKRSSVKGVVVAFTDGGQTKVGWSLCNNDDKFDRFIGIRKAISAAEGIDTIEMKMKMHDEILTPHRICDVLENVIDRVNFKKQPKEA